MECDFKHTVVNYDLVDYGHSTLVVIGDKPICFIAIPFKEAEKFRLRINRIVTRELKNEV